MTEISELNLVERVERNIERVLAQNAELREANAGLTAENARREAVTAAQPPENETHPTKWDRLVCNESVTE